ADQQEGVARHRLAKADEVAIGTLGIELVDPHRPTPGDIDRAIEQRLRRLAWTRRAGEPHLDAFLLISPERQGGVIRRVKHAAQRFLQDDRHRAHPACWIKFWKPASIAAGSLFEIGAISM